MKKNYNYKIFLKILLLLILILILLVHKFKSSFFFEFFNNNKKEDFIIHTGCAYNSASKLIHILQYAFPDKNIIIDTEYKYKPDFVLSDNTYTHGSDYIYRNRQYDCPYICWSGEPVRECPQDKTYPPLCEINSTIVNDTNIKTFYIPFMLYDKNYNLEKIKDRDSTGNINNKKYDFVYIAKNCQAVIREELFRELRNIYVNTDMNNIDKIRSLGHCQRTHNDLINSRENYPNNDQIYRDYKFVFCMENADADGYITEKILLGFLSKSIPIYYGTSRIKEIFNDKAFFYINDYLNDNKTISDIAKILKDLAADDSDNGWKKYLREPIFHNNIEPEIFKIMRTPLNNYAKEIGDYIRDNYIYSKEK